MMQKRSHRLWGKTLLGLLTICCLVGAAGCCMDGLYTCGTFLRWRAAGVPALWDEHQIMDPLLGCLFLGLGGFLFCLRTLIFPPWMEKTEQEEVPAKLSGADAAPASPGNDQPERRSALFAATTRWIARVLGAAFLLWGLAIHRVSGIVGYAAADGMDIVLIMAGTLLVIASGKLAGSVAGAAKEKT